MATTASSPADSGVVSAGGYLPGLTGLRFIAAFVVLVGHIGQFKIWYGIGELTPFVMGAPGQGLWFFFVLSGFLITYLLFNEQKKTSTLSIGKFYVRRILRIWPLYYLMVFLSLIVFPSLGLTVESHFSIGWPEFWPRLLLFLCFLPQVARAYPEVIGSSHLWSIGTEEAFYLFWPLMVKMTKRFSILAILFISLLTFLFSYFYSEVFSGIFGTAPLQAFQQLALGNFQYMCMGAVGAWFACYKPHWCRILFRPEVQGATYYFVIRNLSTAAYYGVYSEFVYGISYVVVIMNVALNPRTFFKFENRVLKFFGDCSYGIYVYQFLCILMVIKGLEQFQLLGPSMLSDVLLFGGSITLTFGISAVSYLYFEKRFLDLRRKFIPH